MKIIKLKKRCLFYEGDCIAEIERLKLKVIELQGKVIKSQMAHLETINKLTQKLVALQMRVAG